MKHLSLVGWDVGAKQKRKLVEDPQTRTINSEDIWMIRFVERVPPTGDTITFEISEEVKDELVRQLTGGIEVARDITV